MRRLKLKFIIALVASGIASLLLPASVGAAGAHHTYSFDLVNANTAVAPADATMSMSGGMTMTVSAGEWISVSGSGTFDPQAGTISGKGTFVHYDKNGAVVCLGNWTATTLVSFLDFGTNEDGQEGGALSLLTTAYCKTMGMTMTAMPMTVTSTVNAPAGSSYIEGTTMCMFTVPTGGAVVMQPEQ